MPVVGKAILFSKVGAVAGEFPGFVAELQTLLTRHGLDVGSFEAVTDLAARIGAGESALRDDLGSMLSWLFAQETQISYLEMLGLLLAAVAGEDRAYELAYEPGLEEPVQELFTFVVEARPAREGSGGGAEENEAGDRYGVAGDRADVADFADEAWAGRVEAGASRSRRDEMHEVASPGLDELSGSVEAYGLRDPKVAYGTTGANGANGGAHGANGANGSILARALALSADQDEFGSGQPGRLTPGDRGRGRVAFVREIGVAEALQRTRVYAVGVSGVAFGFATRICSGAAASCSNC